MAQTQIAKIGWWHERLADWMLNNPDKTLKEAARHFNCTQVWLSIVKNSDCFKIYWATRSNDYSNALTERTVETVVGVREKAAAVTELALDALSTRVESLGTAMPVEQLIDIANMGMKSLGYGVKASSPPATVNVNLGMVSADLLEKARKRAFDSFGVETAQPKVAKQVPIDASYEDISDA